MAIFGWKKGGDQKPVPAAGGAGGSTGGPGAPPSSGGGDGDSPGYQPEKAKRFFEHARTVHNTGNYEYAMQLWLNGLRLDPDSLPAVEGFFGSAGAFMNDDGGKKGVGKDTVKSFSGKSDVDRLLLSMLEWGTKPADAPSAVKAVESSAKLNLAETTYWMGERALKLSLMDKKPRKDLFIKLMESFKTVGAFELAVQAGEGARRLDPADGPLAAEIRNMAAQATMTKGGYDQTGKTGGFRANVRDADKQKLLEDADKIVKTEETVDRLVTAAEEDYKRRPQDQAAITTLATRLRERGKPEDEQRAIEILTKAFQETHQVRFRLLAGEIQVRQARRRASALRQAAEANPSDAAAQRAAQEATVAFIRQEIDELKVKAEAYSTDVAIKYELGRRYFMLEDFEEAIPLLQVAAQDTNAKNRTASLNYLGQSFLKVPGYSDEATATFRQALEASDLMAETQMELRYWLMIALQAKAEDSKDLASAEEAEKLASAIAIQQFNYKDVRQRREAIKKIIGSIKGA